MNRLQELRKEKKLTMVDVYFATGIKMTTLSRYENNKREPKISYLIKLADYFNVSIDYLVGRSDER
ncbi:helix-turn-helix domain-containing protein [Leuconostoc citreum]|uniref:helix-turn-helix domain-containing protein n=1 Tax=Leuconostoc citreum TaxID=33964 RepID=UPI0021A69A96|nr:helix-turn-helix transcriptional regulator [Leuconostoc citreum]MCT3056474.1 XRE family transcriptional regulator [Leuconostoc citreum]MCT3060843.1 XRE family transcriptional regulator [Leuconostoc citreum]